MVTGAAGAALLGEFRLCRLDHKTEGAGPAVRGDHAARLDPLERLESSDAQPLFRLRANLGIEAMVIDEQPHGPCRAARA